MFACQRCFLCEHEDKRLATAQVRSRGKGRGNQVTKCSDERGEKVTEQGRAAAGGGWDNVVFCNSTGVCPVFFILHSGCLCPGRSKATSDPDHLQGSQQRRTLHSSPNCRLTVTLCTLLRRHQHPRFLLGELQSQSKHLQVSAELPYPETALHHSLVMCKALHSL